MTGHIVYRCQCLNVGIHLAHKYYFDGHESYKQNKYVTFENGALTGWKFDLDKKGVTVEHASLVSARKVNDSEWITITCHNCNSGDLYSIKSKLHKTISYPVDSTMINHIDKVIVHKGAKFGDDIDALKQSHAYSEVFRIILNPDLPIHLCSMDKEKDTQLLTQQKHIQQRLSQAIAAFEEYTERKVQLYQQNEEMLLERQKEKAKYDSALLWQTMKEVTRTLQNKEKHPPSLHSQQGEANVSNQETAHHLTDDFLEREMAKRESHIHHAHDYKTVNHQNEQRRRSSVIRKDVFGGYSLPLRQRRRSSHVLDESAILKSFPSNHEQPSLITEVHPFDTLQEVVPITHFEQGNSDVGGNEVIQSGYDEEDIFALDEDLEDTDDDSVLLSGERRSSSRRPSTKYLSDDVDDTVKDHPTPLFAKSVPTCISQVNAGNSVQDLDSLVGKGSRFSSSGLDVAAERDRRVSLQFLPRDTLGREDDLDSEFESGTMIPLHLLAAHTISDESEAIFGSVPHPCTRHRPLD